MADAKQDLTNGSSQSRVVLAKPRLGGFGSSSFGASSNKSSNPFGSVLRPSQLKPSANPFLKVTDECTEEKPIEKPNETSTEDRLTKPEAPKFMPLGTNSTARSNPIPTPVQPATGSSGFVFGQNLSERVLVNKNDKNGDEGSDHSSSNGTSDLLFTSAAATVKDKKDEPTPSSDDAKEGLAAAAAEYERSHARPAPPTNTFNTTGEEGEINVLQISCRLFAWEAGSWRERGRGVLRLNDSAAAGPERPGPGPGSRLVARVAGSLRVVLNTKLWAGMVAERAGAKSLRVTASDAQAQVKLYLIMGAPADIAQLHKALLSRIAVSKQADTITSKQNSSSHAAAERLDNEYDDKPSETLDTHETLETQDKDNPNENKTESQRLDENITDLDNSNDEKQENKLKRKEPTKEELSPKRQCPKVILQ